ncbi:hypothetical protein [uncultured Sphingomonas sp.]|uniref:hypothetical protein n=1 Tax=uncultured Sphingomonas sp. TaxID=158754 RepID=UPI0035CBDBC4
MRQAISLSLLVASALASVIPSLAMATVPAMVPPALADTASIRDGIAKAYACLSGPKNNEFESRVAAERAVRSLGARPSADQRQAARATVLSYIKVRQAGMDCITALKGLEAAVKTSTDRKAISLASRDLKVFWIGQSKYELQILVRFIDQDAGNSEDKLNY